MDVYGNSITFEIMNEKPKLSQRFKKSMMVHTLKVLQHKLHWNAPKFSRRGSWNPQLKVGPLLHVAAIKVARNSFHFPQTSFTNSFPITVWFIVWVWNLPQT